ncbi:MAG: hypothetical protein GY832_20095 [Chloroflexi bacterium]|nr:hypothetical protein [Chloroflexota bacterium]
MQTTIVELIATSRVLVPISHNGTTPTELAEMAKQAYAETVKRELPFDACIESLEHGRITSADKPDEMEVIKHILDEYHAIKPGLNWHNSNGHPISEGEVMLIAISNVLRRLGYVLMPNEEYLGDPAKAYVDWPAGELIYIVLKECGDDGDIMEAIAMALSLSHRVITAEEYCGQRPVTNISLQEA